ncbi:MAG: F0F1 ATP synthase subunit B' [Parvibaculum sp.]|uniref:F0F1 ATP synthase subunit B family protein n=1 Tax=Parvibaculum sp. TaxID=2024848 RepID=UPI0025D992AB|nr:F0F1 ATP synthase subunit B' [Parvibaculum sp.]MCE9649974.1 F0F1 ATP synthase subunit B' [Parvibaculum sp.]
MPQLALETFVPQLVWLAIVFLVLYVLMARIALPRIGSVIEGRRERILSDLDQAAQSKAQTDAAIAAYEKALAEARAKAHGIAQATRDALAAETERKRLDIEGKLNEKIAAAEAAIKATKQTALGNVRTVAVDVAGAIVSQLLGEDADKAATERAVDAAMKG